VYQWIINHVPPHRVYIEPFLGDGAVLRMKRPSEQSIGVEINPAVVETRWQSHDVPGLTVICGDALEVLASYDWRGDEFVYADPPYLLSTRSAQRPLYEYEFFDIEQHRALLTRLRGLPCMVAISGYWSELYELDLAGWRTSTFRTTKRSGAPAIEYLWMNYPPPLELHDYRYLGKNFRERERIKRKKARWTARLAAMPALERYALMEAIEGLRSEASSDRVMVDGDGAIVTCGDGTIATSDEADEAGQPRQK
jgi:hypothetical protein